MKQDKTSARKQGRKTKNRRYLSDISLTKLRSRLSNGNDLIADVDHRSAWMRRLRDIVQDHIADAGGIDLLSTAEQSIIKRASMLELQMEMMEQRFAKNDGEASAHQLLLYQRTASSTRRLLESVGLKRRSKDVTPSLGEYVSRRYSRKAEDADYEEGATT